MALLSLRHRTNTIHQVFALGIIAAMSGGATLLADSPAQACEQLQAKTDTEEANYQSSIDLNNLTLEQQQALEATVVQRRETLPYRSLSLTRCPSLSNAALRAFENKEYAQTLELLDSAIAEKPNSLTRWLDRAIVNYYLGEDNAARADAKQVLRLNAHHSQEINKVYRQLILQLDGELPDPRRAVKL